MRLYRHRKNGKPVGVWWCDFAVEGRRVRTSTKAKDRRTAELVAARSREEPGGADADDDDGPLPLRARHELSTIVDEHAEHPLRFELERLFRAAGFDAREPFTEPLIRLRVDGEARFDSVLHVLASAGYAGFGAYEFEVRTPAGRGQLVYLPYTFCACRLPSSPRWCRVA